MQPIPKTNSSKKVKEKLTEKQFLIKHKYFTFHHDHY